MLVSASFPDEKEMINKFWIVRKEYSLEELINSLLEEELAYEFLEEAKAELEPECKIVTVTVKDSE